ncbi:MAG: DUF559 domain-containing protein [Armatimonadota bacterium]
MDRDDIVTGPHKPLKRVQSRHLRENQTPAEQALWRHLRGSGLGGLHFRRQQIIDGYIVDFYCHPAALVVEVDGDVHSFRREENAVRQQTLERRGLLFAGVSNSQVAQDREGLLNYILHVADQSMGGESTSGDTSSYP